MRRSSSKTSSDDVVIAPAPGAVVTVTDLMLGAMDTPNSGPEHLTIRSIRDSRSPQGSFGFVGVNDVTLENLDAANFYTNWSSNLTIRGGDFGAPRFPATARTRSSTSRPGPTSSSRTRCSTTSGSFRIVASTSSA